MLLYLSIVLCCFVIKFSNKISFHSNLNFQTSIYYTESITERLHIHHKFIYLSNYKHIRPKATRAPSAFHFHVKIWQAGVGNTNKTRLRTQLEHSDNIECFLYVSGEYLSSICSTEFKGLRISLWVGCVTGRWGKYEFSRFAYFEF